MATAFIHNRVLRLPSKFPEFSYTGAYTVVDNGETSGTWQIALTGSGTLTLTKRARSVTIKARGGGGGGGAGDAYTRGTDGTDGSIQSTTRDLAAGTYSVTLGAKGNAHYDSAGSAGGATKFGSILTASGGAGGAYKGGSTKSHTTLYGNYGKGGTGGSTSQYQGTVTTRSYLKGTYPIYSEPDDTSEVLGTMVSGTKYYCSDTVKSGPDGTHYWVLNQGGYVSWKDTNGSYSETVADNREWYGNYGNAGVVVLSGKT